VWFDDDAQRLLLPVRQLRNHVRVFLNARRTGPSSVLLISLAGGLVAAGAARAQTRDDPTFDDLMLVRGRPTAYRELLQIRAGLLGGIPASEDEENGLERKYSPDGHVYYLSDALMGRDTQTVLYGGRDGVYAAFKQGSFEQVGSESRIELFGRLWPFYREGFYEDGDFVSVGRYEGRDVGGRLGFSSLLQEGMRIEIAGKYTRHSFDRNDDTAPEYTIPEDFNSYGVRLTAEHNTMTLDRRIHWPVAGFIATAFVEVEWNDSKGRFGITGRISELPSRLVRGGGRLEYLYPASESGTWAVTVDAGMSDEKDRTVVYDAQKPLGDLWVDGSVGYRLMLGETTGVTPGVKGQWLRLEDEFGRGSDNEFFVGGYLKVRGDVSESVSVVVEYSYLSNPSREPVSISEDTLGEHRVFVGGVVRFGTPGR
jgi:hypothetical protein